MLARLFSGTIALSGIWVVGSPTHRLAPTIGPAVATAIAQGSIARSIAQTRPIGDDHLGLGPLRLGWPAARVRQVLGPPLGIRREHHANYDRYEHWHYADLDLELGNNQVAVMASSHPRWVTPDGLKVGDRVDRLRVLYAKYGTEGDGTSFSTSTGAYLTFEIVGDRVTKIICGWLPD